MAKEKTIKAKKEIYAEEVRKLEVKFPEEFLKNPKELIVREAAKKNSPLHSYFEWNDDAAAHKYRLEQAGMLMHECTRIFTNSVTHLDKEVNEYTFFQRDGSVRKTRELLESSMDRVPALEMEIRFYEGSVERLAGYLTGAGLHSTAAKLQKFTKVIRAEVYNSDSKNAAGH